MPEPTSSEKHEKNTLVRLKGLNDLPGFPVSGMPADSDIHNYNFLGWNRDRFGVAAEYGGAGLPTMAQFDRNVTLYGMWTLKWCWVTFNTMGGSGVNYSIQILKGTTLTASQFPTTQKDGYIFLGWYTAPVGGVVVSTNTVILDDTILFAQWQIDYDIFLANVDGMIGSAIDELDLSSLIDDIAALIAAAGSSSSGGGGADEKPKIPKAPFWMAEDGSYEWTDDSGAYTSGRWYPGTGDNQYEVKEYPSTTRFYVDTHWYTLGAADGYVRHLAADGTRVCCSTYCNYTTQGGWDGEKYYRVLHFTSGGQRYDKYYRKVNILPGRDMTSLPKSSDCIYPQDGSQAQMYQSPGHKLVRWYACATGRHDDGKKSHIPQSLEQQLRGVKEEAAAWHAPGGPITSAHMGQQIMKATSLVNTGDTYVQAWLNCSDYARKLNGEDHGFAFWADRYPIP